MPLRTLEYLTPVTRPTRSWLSFDLATPNPRQSPPIPKFLRSSLRPLTFAHVFFPFHSFAGHRFHAPVRPQADFLYLRSSMLPANLRSLPLLIFKTAIMRCFSAVLSFFGTSLFAFCRWPLSHYPPPPFHAPSAYLNLSRPSPRFTFSTFFLFLASPCFLITTLFFCSCTQTTIGVPSSTPGLTRRLFLSVLMGCFPLLLA